MGVEIQMQSQRPEFICEGHWPHYKERKKFENSEQPKAKKNILIGKGEGVVEI